MSRQVCGCVHQHVDRLPDGSVRCYACGCPPGPAHIYNRRNGRQHEIDPRTLWMARWDVRVAQGQPDNLRTVIHA